MNLNTKKSLLGIAAGVLVPVTIWAADAVLPHTFTAGTAIKAEEVNANFTALREAVNGKEDRGTTGGSSSPSGTRLKVVGLISPDGARLPFGDNEKVFYDSELGTYCEVDENDLGDAPASPNFRCMPGSDLIRARIAFTNSTCTQRVGLRQARTLPAGLPVPTRVFGIDTADSAATQWYEFTGSGSAFSGTVYNVSQQCDENGCTPSCYPSETVTGATVFTVSPVPLSTFAPLNAGLL